LESKNVTVRIVETIGPTTTETLSSTSSLRRALHGRVVLTSVVLVLVSISALKAAQPSRSETRRTFIVYGCGLGFFNMCGIVPETGEVRQLTTDGTGRRPYLGPSLSPDGRRLTFAYDGGVYLASQEANDRQEVGNLGHALFTALRPDGERIAVGVSTVSCPFQRPCTGREKLKILTLAGEQRHSFPHGFYPAWRGRSLIIARGSALWSWSGARFSQRRRLFSLRDADLVWPSVSPDNRLIAVGAERHGESHVVLFSTRDRKLRRLTSGGFDGSPAWSPDGAQIVFARGNSRELYVVDRAGRTEPRPLGVRGINPTWGMQVEA
jgi:hypothetical protein